MQQVTVRVPASTSNLGPGYDCLGVALRLHNSVTLVRGKTPTSAHPRIVSDAAERFFNRTRCHKFSFSFSIVEQVPRCRGLGSSATVRLGVLLGLNRLYKERIEKVNVHIRRALTFFAVVLGWLFFRVTDFHMAAVMLNHMFTYHAGLRMMAQPGLILLLAISFGIARFAKNTFELDHDWNLAMSGAFAIAYVLCLAVVAGGIATPFLYFQF